MENVTNRDLGIKMFIQMIKKRKVFFVNLFEYTSLYVLLCVLKIAVKGGRKSYYFLSPFKKGRKATHY
uniref:Uncharacterized protein n=1 Tax=Meloidogyne enterolobii TaxID=390850 RepID=A0A6V7VJ57_MELEN|nr:unnamed protein product [Meloidogyne enterolobii]